MKLIMDGGKPWQTFAVERAAFVLGYHNVGLGYRLFKSFVLGLTLITPPRRFYQLRNWYAAAGLRRVREYLGKATEASPIIQQGFEDAPPTRRRTFG
jgi:hypothetical protein